MRFHNRDIISITDFSREETLYLCKQAKRMYDLEKSGKRYQFAEPLKNKALASLFFEPSTRTRTSFNTAIRELGGVYDGFSGEEGTSVMKKESIRDTIMMMDANHFDVIVMRHPKDGSLQWAADVSNVPVINGGDGKNEHPTQSLLDIFTLYILNNDNLDNISIGFGGDLSHGRTIRSLSLALSHFNNITIRWSAEDFLGMPQDLAELLNLRGVIVVREKSVKDVMSKVQFYYMTRPQIERMEGVTQKEIMEMIKKYRIDIEKVKDFEIMLMHPLPVNSEIAEIDYKVYFNKCQVFFQQSENGIFMRKALLYEMLKNNEGIKYNGKLHPDLEHGNNRLKRDISKKPLKDDHKHMVRFINEGTSIDHLIKGKAEEVSSKLALKDKGSSFSGTTDKKTTSFLKTAIPELGERDLKNISLISPEPTINYIKNGKVIDKFVYLLCRNTNCITKMINEDVPPKFYNDKGTIRCRYCRKPYTVTNHKVLPHELKRYIDSLPKSIKTIKTI